MSALKDKIQRAIESTSNDVTQWHQQPLSTVAQAVHDHIVRDLSPDNVIEELKKELEEVKQNRQFLEEENEALEKEIVELKAKPDTTDNVVEEPKTEDEVVEDEVAVEQPKKKKSKKS